jgi:Domain of unknown function (DUF1877)
MGMICELFIVPAASAREVLDQPAKIHELYNSLMGSGAGLSLEKSWHGLHFVLTGTAWEGVSPLNWRGRLGASWREVRAESDAAPDRGRHPVFPSFSNWGHRDEIA